MSDPRRPEDVVGGHARAAEHSRPGTLQHFLLRNGFFPHDEADAEAILLRVIEDNERLTELVERLS